MIEEPKYRNEIKYIITTCEMEILKTNLAAVMTLDKNTEDDGWYDIRSIYFDDLYDTLYQQNEDGVSPREKWRIRSYNCSQDWIVLERKKKEDDRTQKISCQITYKEYERLIMGECIWDSGDRPLLNWFTMLMLKRQMRPKVMVCYRRIPFVCLNGNVRICFDCEIASSPDIDSFFSKNIRRRIVLPMGYNLLEVKFDEFLPDYIYHAIQQRDMRPETFSKYSLSRKYSILIKPYT